MLKKLFFDKLTGLLTYPGYFPTTAPSIMLDSACFVKSTPLRAFTGSFKHFADMLDILKMCMKKFDAEKMFFFNELTGLSLEVSTLCRYLL